MLVVDQVVMNKPGTNRNPAAPGGGGDGGGKDSP